jgi:hypothetical protein
MSPGVSLRVPVDMLKVNVPETWSVVSVSEHPWKAKVPPAASQLAVGSPAYPVAQLSVHSDCVLAWQPVIS